MREEIGLVLYLAGSAELEQMPMGVEELVNLVIVLVVTSTIIDVGADVSKIVIAEEESNVIGMRLLECDDLEERVDSILASDSFSTVGVEIIAKEDDVVGLVVADGLLPEGASVYVGYDNHSVID